jgi:hypothetical protein
MRQLLFSETLTLLFYEALEERAQREREGGGGGGVRSHTLMSLCFSKKIFFFMGGRGEQRVSTHTHNSARLLYLVFFEQNIITTHYSDNIPV